MKNNINNIAYVMSNQSQQQQHRSYSESSATREEKKEEADKAAADDDAAAAAADAGGGAAKAADASEDVVAKLQTEVKELKDQLLRSMAEQENVRRIARMDVDNARQFGVQSFAKSMLDVADNFERALTSINPETHEQIKSGKYKGDPLLSSLVEGITAVEKGLQKALAGHGVVKFGVPGDTFNPEQHEALFQIPDATQEEGLVAQVVKPGYMLKERVLRAAQVGTTKK
jgi:molecular chaperone GrpE